MNTTRLTRETRSTYTRGHREAGDILPLGRSAKDQALILEDAAEFDRLTNEARIRLGFPPLERAPMTMQEPQAAVEWVVPRIKRGRYAREVMPEAEYQALRARVLELAEQRPLLWQRLVVVGRISWEAMVAFRDDTRVLPLVTTEKLERVLNECYTLAVYRGGRKAGRKVQGKGGRVL